MNLQRNKSLKNHTTIKVGGESEYFSEPLNISELVKQLHWAKHNNYKYRIIGAGSNLLIKDKRLEGLTICTKKLKSIFINPKSGSSSAECGVMLPTLSNLLSKNGCEGGEWIIGIPGTIGGAIFMNAGSGDYSISNNLISVEAIDMKP